MAKRPTALAFAKKQLSWGKHRAEKAREAIAEAERAQVFQVLLDDLYDDEFFWLRFADHMEEQVEFLRTAYGDDTRVV